MKRVWLLIAVMLFAMCAAQAQRLPDTVVPISYQLTIVPDLDEETFTGEAVIHVTLTQPSKTVTLNALELTFKDVAIEAGGKTQTASVALDADKETATLTVADEIPAGPAILRMSYSGKINQQQNGFYISKSKTRKYAVTQLQATHARRMFPSFDEPAMKATYELTAVIDNGDVAISNGKVVSDTAGPGVGKHTVKFSPSPKMSTYLVALAVGDFKCVEGEQDGTPTRVCAPAGREALLGFALESSKAFLKYFNEYYGIKYPFEKLDHIGVPDHEAGAMENTGAIIYREGLLLLDDKTATPANRRLVAYVIAHEMAHMWFGDLVTMKWWDDLWLNEGFATWMGNKAMGAWKPEWHMELENIQAQTNAMTADSGVTRPAHQMVETPAEIAGSFDGIAYYKTAAMIRMLEQYAGEEAWRKGVMAHLKAHEYGNATSAEFWATMAKATGKPLNKIGPTFIDQAGLPLVDVKAQCSGNATKVTFEQRRYFFDRAKFDAGNDQVWIFPVCVKAIGADGKSQTKCETVSQKSQTFKLNGCAKAIYPNAGGLGFYRYSFAPETMKTIAPSLSAAEKINLIGNEWALVRVGRHDMGDYLSLADALKGDRTRQVLTELTMRIGYMDRNLISEAERPAFQAWVRQRFGPMLKEVGYTPQPSDSLDTRQLRSALYNMLGIIGHDKDVAQRARELAEQYMRDATTVEPSLAAAAVNVAAWHGDAALHATFVERYKSAKSPEEAQRYLNALAAFGDPELLKKSLEFTLSPEVRSNDLIVIATIMGNRKGLAPGWDFVKAHYGDIEKKIGTGATQAVGVLGQVITGAAAFCNADAREDVRRFLAEHPQALGERAKRTTLDGITNCVDLKNQHAVNLADWLQKAPRQAGL